MVDLSPFLLLALIIIPLYKLLKTRLGAHPLDNVPGPRATSWRNGLFNDVYGIGSVSRNFHETVGKNYGTTFSFPSVYGERELYTFDPKAMHHILVKDHSEFYEETPGFFEGVKLIFGGGLLATTGNVHRKQRKMLNPVFSIAHMREMVPIFYEVTHKLEAAIDRKVKDGAQEIDMLSWMSRTALELIGQAGLGYSFDNLDNEEHAHPYPQTLKGLLPMLGKSHFARTYILPIAAQIASPETWGWLVPFIPSRDLQYGRHLANYMWTLSTDIYEGKKKALALGDEEVTQQIGRGKDILSILMKENMKSSEDDRLDERAVISQMSTLLFAAMDTTSNALSRTLTLLAENPRVQSRLREELDEAFDAGDIPYDKLVSLPYLDAICRETLRLHPPVHRLLRTTLKDTTLPLTNPVTGIDGSTISEIFMPKGTGIVVSILNSNRNPDIWGADAGEWKPERWLNALPDSVVDAKIPGVYSHLMTFNGGGRSCIGFKFSQLEMKVVLARLVHRFEFAPTDKEIFWRMSGVSSPIVVGSGASEAAKLPIMVKLVERQ